MVLMAVACISAVLTDATGVVVVIGLRSWVSVDTVVGVVVMIPCQIDVSMVCAGATVGVVATVVIQSGTIVPEGGRAGDGVCAAGKAGMKQIVLSRFVMGTKLTGLMCTIQLPIMVPDIPISVGCWTLP